MATEVAEILAQYPNLNIFLERLAKLAPLQRRAFDNRAHELKHDFLEDTEQFFTQFFALLNSTSTPLDEAVQSYISICKDTFREQIQFARTGHYSAATISEALRTVETYEAMTRYMLGLAVTQYLWQQHYDTLQFFRAFLHEREITGRYLEIGPGHGLYLLEALNRAHNATFDAVDISQASADIARNMVCFLSPLGKHVSFHVQDIFKWMPSQAYDTITMGEVLEHVEDPLNLLKRAASFLKPDGRLFITTCANCPAIDHVYLFKSADHIRDTIAAAGCRIVEEHVADRDYGMRGKDGTAILITQYAAVLTKSA